MVNSL